MITKRIIPCLDVKNGRVVKGVNFEGLNDVSDPVSLGKYYSDHGADELVFYDITASAEGRALFTDILTETARVALAIISKGNSPTMDLCKTIFCTNAAFCRWRARNIPIPLARNFS